MQCARLWTLVHLSRQIHQNLLLILTFFSILDISLFVASLTLGPVAAETDLQFFFMGQTVWSPDTR